MAARAEKAPRVVRPAMGNYGVPSSLKGTIAWSRARKLLSESHNYWVTTIHPSGRPHASAVWGLWLDGAFWFSCSPKSRKAKNLAANPACTITTERADEAVIIEGVARPVRGRARLTPFVRGYNKKYDWQMDPAADGYYAVTPKIGFAFIEHSGQFQSTATKYEFGGRRKTKRSA